MRDRFYKVQYVHLPVTRDTSAGCVVSQLGDCVQAYAKTQNGFSLGVNKMTQQKTEQKWNIKYKILICFHALCGSVIIS